jgi:UDP-2-acetamido-2,6-beta-L-arabino-hexul-4-ose reductase
MGGDVPHPPLLQLELPMKVLVTGAAGFLGRNLCVELARRSDVDLIRFDVDTPARGLDEGLARAEIVFHLAGVNRPDKAEEFHKGNAELTRRICAKLVALGTKPKIVLSSSIQAELDNPYGLSKRGAEESIRAYTEKTNAAGVVYRLKNLFGKWCRPNYNSVTATFCHNIANGLPIQISDPANVVDLTYVDDVVAPFMAELTEMRPGFRMAESLPSHSITLGELADLIKGFRDARQTLRLPDFSLPFVRALYATYLSYLPTDGFAYGLDVKTDPRGRLAELLKQPCFGQIFVSRTRPGATRGNHFHHTKVEKFLVLEGEAVIRFRPIEGDAVTEYPVRGEDFKVVDIPPGYTHSIENVGPGDLVTLFWANQVFDETKPDTLFLPVIKQGGPT